MGETTPGRTSAIKDTGSISIPAIGSLLLVFVIATVLRLGWLDLIQFNFDEARHLERSLTVLTEHKPALVGSPSSVGPDKPPLMVYLLIPPLLISRDPVVATGFIALLNVGAVLGCFWLTREYFGSLAGFVSGLLFAVSPWAVIFSRKIFTADLIAPFTVLFFYSLFAALIKRKQHHLFLACIWITCLLQITFSTLPLALLMIVLLFLYRSRIQRKPLVSGVVAGGLLFAPYMYHDLTHGFANLRGLLQATSGTTRFDVVAVKYALSLISGDNLHALAGHSAAAFIDQRPTVTWLDKAETLLFLGGVGYLLFAVARNALQRSRDDNQDQEDIPPHLLLLGWILTPVLFNLRHSVDLYPHYFTLLYPAPYIIIGIFIARATQFAKRFTAGHRDSHPVGPSLFSKAPALLSAVPLLLVMIIAVWQIFSVVFLFKFVQTHDTRGGYGVPLRFWKKAVGLASLEAEARGLGDVQIVTEGNEPAYDQMPAILAYLLPTDLKPRFLGTPAVLLPHSRDLLYLITVEDPWLTRYLERLGRKLHSVKLPGNEQVVQVYLLEERSWHELEAIPQHPEQAAYRNGVHLWGYDLPDRVAPGQSVPLTLYWSLKSLGAADQDELYSVFNHFVDAADHRWTQDDGLALPRYAWRDGDVLALGYNMALPENIPTGRYWLRTGIYSLEDGHRVATLDKAGGPTSDSVKLGPIEVSTP